MARQENIWLMFEQVRLRHLMVEAAGRVMEVLIGEQVDVGAALVFVYLSHLLSDENVKGDTRKESGVGRKQQDHFKS